METGPDTLLVKIYPHPPPDPGVEQSQHLLLSQEGFLALSALRRGVRVGVEARGSEEEDRGSGAPEGEVEGGDGIRGLAVLQTLPEPGVLQPERRAGQNVQCPADSDGGSVYG